MMIECKDLVCRYDSVTEVRLPDFSMPSGGELLIHGLSGSGKSTLLHILAGVLKPSEGIYLLNNVNIYDMNESDRDKFRGKNIGLVFQQMHLIRTLNVMDNIKLAQYLAGYKPEPKKIKNICDELEIADKINVFPEQLSYGQKQRVTIARAIINHPIVLLADEPTSSLDDLRSEKVIRMLKSQAKKTGAMLIISTHDHRIKKHFSETVYLDEMVTELV